MVMQAWSRSVMAFVVALVERILQRVAQELWNETWRQILAAVQEAEARWQEAGRGKAKRQWVIDQVLAFVEERTKLNWLQRQLVRLFIGEVVDAIIRSVNEELGHDWAAKVKAVERRLAQALPMVE